jgi:hypothetical protein
MVDSGRQNWVVKFALVCGHHGSTVGSGDSNGEHGRAFVKDWDRNGAKVSSATGVGNSGVEGIVGTQWSVGRRTYSAVLLFCDVRLLTCRQQDVGFNNIALTLVDCAVFFTMALGFPRCHS